MTETITDCCAVCRRPIAQPITGRRRLTCSDRCRAQLARDRRYRREQGAPSPAESRRQRSGRKIAPVASQNG